MSVMRNAIFGAALLLLAAAGAALWSAWARGRGPRRDTAPVASSRAIGSLEPPAARQFTDVTAAAGIDFVHENGARGRRFLPETTAGGAGWIDHDADGHLDLYLVNGNVHADRGGQGDTPGRLYRNRGDGTFADVTAAAGAANRGYGGGLAVGDYDNDGFSDLYVTNLGPNVLFHNLGGRFEDATARAGVAGGGWSTSAAFLDHDRDGDLDLYVCRYVEYDPAHECRQRGILTHCSPHEFPGAPDLLFRNNGDGTFADASREAGIAVAGPAAGKSLGVVVLDHDGDGDPDLYVACDQVPNLLFTNDGGGKFTEVGLLANVAYSGEGIAQAGMGIDAGDIDLDGRPDLVVTNFADEPDTLYRNEGGGFFTDATRSFDLAGPTLRPLAFGVLLIDFDLDADLDLYIANGHVHDNIAEISPGQTYAQTDLCLENQEGRRFTDRSRQMGDWFSRAHVGRAAASADYDQDGDEDIVVLNSGARPALLRNDGAPGAGGAAANHWIAFRLRGTKSNRDGYGASVTVAARGPRGPFRRSFECRSARSYQAACDPRVRCGLGTGPVAVEVVEVRWPSGALQSLPAPAIDRVHEVVEP
jgi:hypothetical protein